MVNQYAFANLYHGKYGDKTIAQTWSCLRTAFWK